VSCEPNAPGEPAWPAWSSEWGGGGFLGNGNGSSKTPQKCFCEKSMSSTFLEKIGVFPRLPLVLSHFRVFLSDGSSKTQQKTSYKKIASKSFCKKIDQKKPKPTFSRFSFIAFLGVSR
jgi:hypothetical protein